jgi:hypothetical protein
MMVVNVTQIDLALFSTLISELASFYTIRVLLNEKTFGNETQKSLNEPLLIV